MTLDGHLRSWRKMKRKRCLDLQLQINCLLLEKIKHVQQLGKKNNNEGSPLICVKDCHNVKRKTITAGKKTNHNNPRKCLLYHGPFHFAFTSSPHILLSGRRTTWTNPLNFFQKIGSIILCIRYFPLKALADQESKWIRITFHRMTVPYKLHFGAGTSLYQLFSTFSHVLCVAAKEQRVKLCWWKCKTHIFSLSGG